MNCLGYTENYVWFTTFNIGKGTFGLVYQGTHKKTGEEVAVKTFSHVRPLDIPIREFEVMKLLSHENIVKLIAIEEEVQTKRKVLIMELCRGGNLQNILDDPPNAYGLEEREFLNVLKDLTAGLKYLRDTNIVHRDLKPANVMKYITEDGCSIYKLADFGSARYLEDNQQYQSLHGTEEYLHPLLYKTAVLQKDKEKAFGATTDLWSVGVTIYQMATSSLPFLPFGGRQNRDTMLYIHNNKQSGVISGIQYVKDQPIVWSKELPKTCLLSKELRDLITVLLVHILECNPKKIWSFDQFFECVTDIISRKIFHIFYMNEGKEITLYMQPHKKLQDLKEKIYTQTQVCSVSQLLLFDKSLFLSQLNPSSDVSKFPTTSFDNPLILVHMENTNLKYLTPTEDVPLFPIFSESLNSTVKDASVAEDCCIKAYAIKRFVVKLVRCQELLLQTPKILLSLSAENVSKLCSNFEGLKFKADAVSYMCKLLKKTVSVVSQYISADVTVDENHDSNTRIIYNSINEKVTEKRESVDKIKEELAQLLSSFNVMKQQVLISKNMKSGYEQILSKLPSLDKCIELASTLVGKMRDSWQVFTRHRYKKVLSIQDQQFHVLERVKMQNTCNKFSLLQTEVLNIHMQTSNNLSDWYSGVQTVMTKCHCLETVLHSVNNDLATCSSSLQQLEPELFELIKRITDDDFYLEISSNNNSKHQKQVPVIKEDLKVDEGLYKDILASLHAFKKGQQGVWQSIEENKHLVKKFRCYIQNLREDIKKLEADSASEAC